MGEEQKDEKGAGGMKDFRGMTNVVGASVPGVENCERPGRGNARRGGGIAMRLSSIYLFVAMTGAIGAFTVLPVSASAAECSNEAIRKLEPSGQSLPDCRAYEQVTPVEKAGENAPVISTSNSLTSLPRVAADGERAAYYSQGGFSGTPASIPFYLASRETTGWANEGMFPQQSTWTAVLGAATAFCPLKYSAYSSNLTSGVFVDGGEQKVGCGADDPVLVPGESVGVANVFIRDNTNGTYQLISLKPISGSPADAKFEGATPDLSHVVFDEAAELTPEAISGKMLYEWTEGHVSLLNQVPSSGTSCIAAACTVVANVGGGLAAADAGLGGVTNTTKSSVLGRVSGAVAEDGGRVFFNVGGSPAHLYLREVNSETTVEVDASQGGSGESGEGHYQAAASDGSSVFFTDGNKLTSNSTAAGVSALDLYRYDVESGDLRDLTVDSTDVNGAEAQGVVGASADGSYVYYVAKGVLAAGATAGQPNLYLWHSGTTRFIATLAATDQSDWNGESTARVSPDGVHLVFNSVASLTGYNNTDQSTAKADTEVFLYDAESKALACVSCNPSGAAPIGPSQINSKGTNSETNATLQRNLLADGSRVFFNSSDALVGSDTNGKQDVYEWEADGTGSCNSSTVAGGCLYLISSGRGAYNSYFFDAAANGSDVFFSTANQLVGQDEDGLIDLYDARVEGGLASQNATPHGSCSGEGCRNMVAETPMSSPPASVSFAGPGNLTPSSPVSGDKSSVKSKKLEQAQLKRSLKRCRAKYEHSRRKRQACERSARASARGGAR